MVYTVITTAGEGSQFKCRVVHSTFDYKDAIEKVQCDYPTEKVVALVRGDHGDSTYCIPEQSSKNIRRS